MDQADINQLLKRCINQDIKAQEQLYKSFYGYALGICMRYSANRTDAKHILNDGFYKVFTHLGKYEFDKPFPAWLGRIMSNTAIDHYRSELRFMNTVEVNENDAQCARAAIEDKLHYEDILGLVQELPTAYRTVFNLFAIDGYSHDEIAKQLGISVGTSKSNLFKARKSLQEMLKKREHTETGKVIRMSEYKDQYKKISN